MTPRENTQQELREEIDATRRELAETVEQLAARTDVKARLQDHVELVEDDVKRAVERRPIGAVMVGATAIVLLVVWALSQRRNVGRRRRDRVVADA